MSYEPVLGGDYNNGKHKHGGACCGPGWQQTGIFWISLAGVCLFAGLLIALVAKGDQLEATSRATVAMHEETIETKTKIEKALSDWRSKFPENQETLTTEQVLDSIDKAHNMMVWAEGVTRQVETNEIKTIVRNVDRLVGNVTTFVEIITAAFTPTPNTMAKSKKDQTDRVLESARGLLFKTVDLLSELKAADVRDMFLSVKRGVDSVNDITKKVKGDTVAKILTNAAEVLASAESEHVVDVISRISKGALEIIDRFKQSEGIRISIPLDHPSAAAISAPSSSSSMDKKSA